MTIWDIIAIFLILDLAGIIHIICIKKDVLKFLRIPISKQWFWENKTYRGLILMSLLSGIIGSCYFGFWFAMSLGLIWIIWELPNSAIKRSLNIKPGGYITGGWVLIQYIADTIDSIFFLLIFLNVLFPIPLEMNFILLIAWCLNHIIIDIICYKIGIKKLNFGNPFIIFNQIILWILFRPYMWYFVTKQWKSYHIFEKKNPKILISNHISQLDPFLICGTLPFKKFFSCLPFRFMTSNQFMDRIFRWIFLRMVWWYRAYDLDLQGNNQSLETSKRFLHQHETLMIFPEWGIRYHKFWVGAFYLNAHVEWSVLLCFHIAKDSHHYKITFNGKAELTDPSGDLMPQGKQIFQTFCYECNKT